MEPYELRRGGFSRITLRLTGPRGTLRVSAPWFVPRSVVDRFVEAQAGWVAERRRSLVRPLSGTVAVWGQVCRVRFESPGKLPRVLWDRDSGEVSVRVPGTWDEVQRQGVLDRWEKDRVREALGALVPAWEDRTGLKVARWTVKRLRSRWGSCRPDTRSLVFNTRLGALPPVCLEHVVVHEMAHLVEPNHGPRFHALVESWLPVSAEVERLLKDQGRSAGPAGSTGGPGTPPTPGEETEL